MSTTGMITRQMSKRDNTSVTTNENEVKGDNAGDNNEKTKVKPSNSGSQSNEKTDETLDDAENTLIERKSNINGDFLATKLTSKAAVKGKPSSTKSKIKSTTSSNGKLEKLKLELHYMQKQEEILHQQRQLDHKKKMLEIEQKLEMLNVEECDEKISEITDDNFTSISDDQSQKLMDTSEWVKSQQGRPSKKVCEINNFENKCQTIKMPELDMQNFIARQTIPQTLPEFAGDPLDWPFFLSEFNNSTSICKLTNYENLLRLRRSLSGKAKECVQSLLILPQNVELIIETLSNRFGNPNHIVRHLIEKIRNFPSIRDDKIETFLKFFDVLTNLIGTLQSLDQNDHIRNPILFEEILNKLPISQRIAFIQYFDDISTTQPRILVLHKWLSRKEHAASQLVSFPTEDDKYKLKGAKPKHDLTLTTTDKRDFQKPYCHYCKSESHRIYDCQKFLKLDVEKKWEHVTDNSLCISCLGKNHNSRNCKRRKSCNIDKCTRPHNKLLHKPKSSSCNDTVPQKETSENIDKNFNINMQKSQVLLKVIPIKIEGANKTVDTFALLDDASTVTIIDQDLANDLGLDGPTHPLKLQWTNEQTNEQEDSKIVTVKIRGTSEFAKTFTLRRVKTLSGLSLPTQTIDVDQISNLQPYIKSFANVSFKNAKPQLLIGQDNWPLIINRKSKYGSWNGPVASKTLLGWVIHGNLPNMTETNKDFLFHVYDGSTNLTEKDDLQNIHDLIKQQWKLETDVISNDVELSKDDRRCIKIMDKTLKRVDDRFECGLFWKDDNLKLPESYSTAMTRLRQLENRMDRDVEYSKKYCDKINEYIEKGYLKKLSENEARLMTNLTWYLPHFGVINPNKPEKLRIVFDAAAKSHGSSLNDYLLTGPDLYNSLPTILSNFRFPKVAFVGDIKEMFLQIRVRSEDRFSQRILWRDTNRKDKPNVYEIQVVFFGAKSSPCIAQEVKNRNALEFSDRYPIASNEIIHKHYMDDYLGGANSVEEAVQIINDVIHIHKNGGFEMCNWISNSQDVLRQIDSNIKLTNQKEIDDGLKSERVLGLWWDYQEDNFSFRLKFHKLKHPEILNLTKRPTKRDILGVIMAIFDPLGFLSNFLIGGKILLQSIWESAIDWDDVLLDEQFTLWKDWCRKLEMVSKFSIPRQLTSLPLDKCSIQLHIFCDASKYAYASCAYLRFDYDGQIDCSLVTSKSRVAPLKPTSIPRLELQAALQGAKMHKHLKISLNVKIDKTFLWTDSEVVLSWIRSSSKRFKVFVAQRLGEIQEITDSSDWRHVPSKFNIADDATKVKPIDFSTNSSWIKGPSFLYTSENEWPQKQNFNNILGLSEDCEKEYVNIITEEVYDINILLPEVTKFSNWNRYVRVTAWVLRFVTMIKKNTKRSIHTELQPQEIVNAEQLIYRKIQFDSYLNEIRRLIKKQAMSRLSSIRTLPLMLDDKYVIRLYGRMGNVDDDEMSYCSKNPILLDGKHPITLLIIDYYHRQNCHIGTDTIISNLRKSFWITGIRNAVKRVAYDCQYCRNRKAQPQTPKMAPLPSCRVNPTIRPFIKTGIDYFGPIEVTVNRKHEKRYGVIFTCMVTRAVHLDIAQDLSHNAFLHVFRQFGCRRGFPEELYSDNGSNFRKADKEIRKEIDSWPQDEITRQLTMKKCKWVFNPPITPHMGGAWERLIQSVKNHLSFLLNERYPKEYVLRTLFCEVENMMNNRPLTDISLDCEDSQPLTPNDFLIGPSSASLQFAQTTEKDLHLLSMWKATQQLTDIFWKHWKKSYRQHILVNRKWSKDCKNLDVGDVVLVVDPDGPRNVWPKGIIVKIFPSSDGRIRIVDVKTTSGIFRRPVVKLIKLDVSNKSIP